MKYITAIFFTEEKKPKVRYSSNTGNTAVEAAEQSKMLMGMLAPAGSKNVYYKTYKLGDVNLL